MRAREEVIAPLMEPPQKSIPKLLLAEWVVFRDTLEDFVRKELQPEKAHQRCPCQGQVQSIQNLSQVC